MAPRNKSGSQRAMYVMWGTYKTTRMLAQKDRCRKRVKRRAKKLMARLGGTSKEKKTPKPEESRGQRFASKGESGGQRELWV